MWTICISVDFSVHCSSSAVRLLRVTLSTVEVTDLHALQQLCCQTGSHHNVHTFSSSGCGRKCAACCRVATRVHLTATCCVTLPPCCRRPSSTLAAASRHRLRCCGTPPLVVTPHRWATRLTCSKSWLGGGGTRVSGFQPLVHGHCFFNHLFSSNCFPWMFFCCCPICCAKTASLDTGWFLMQNFLLYIVFYLFSFVFALQRLVLFDRKWFSMQNFLFQFTVTLHPKRP